MDQSFADSSKWANVSPSKSENSSEASTKAELRARLVALRNAAIADGLPLLSSEAILAEKDIARRR